MHGLILSNVSIFFLNAFQYTVEEFEESENPPNAGFVVMERKEVIKRLINLKINCVESFESYFCCYC